MPDLMVNLLKLSPLEAELVHMERSGFVLRRAQPFEISPVCDFIEHEFSVAWADEISVGFGNKPVTVYIAIADQEVVGFAGYECTRRAFFGPAGVLESVQGRGVGKSLLLACLWGLREMGYVYAIIGAAGPIEFYERAVGAIVIPDSEPGIYKDMLK